MRAGPDIDQERQDAAKSGPQMRTSPASVPVSVRPDHSTWMMTSLLLWLCTLPIIGLLVLPWLGARVAIVVAAVLLVASAAGCYGVCTWQVAGPKRGGRNE